MECPTSKYRRGRFIAGLTHLSFATRDKLPKQVERASNVDELAAAMDKPDTEAAVLESGEVASQEEFVPLAEAIHRCLQEVVEEFFYHVSTEVSAIGNDGPYLARADQALVNLNAWLGLSSEQADAVHGFVHTILKDMLKTMRAFKNKKIVPYSVRFLLQDHARSTESIGYHPDGSYGPYHPETRVVRTYVGPSTMLMHEPRNRELSKPGRGATVALRLGKPLDIWHSIPRIAEGEIRLNLIFDVAALDTKYDY